MLITGRDASSDQEDIMLKCNIPVGEVTWYPALVSLPCNYSAINLFKPFGTITNMNEKIVIFSYKLLK